MPMPPATPVDRLDVNFIVSSAAFIATSKTGEEAVCAGRSRGCDVASLQASKLGFPVHGRLGFENDRHDALFASP